MAIGFLDTAVSGLLAFQQSLATTSHNIANVNTEGFSRQRTELETKPEFYIGDAGYLGNGVKAAAVRRIYDAFLGAQINTSTSATGQLEAYNQLASEVDNFIADPQTSLPKTLQSFFDAVHNLVNDPTSIPVRQGVLTTARSLVDRFNTISGQLDQIRSRVDQSMEDGVAQVNALAANIGAVNQRILDAAGASNGVAPNDLLDQRDLLISKLAQYVDLQVVPDNSGALNVLIGTGQALVMGTQAASLKVADSRYVGGPKDVFLSAPGSKVSVNISNQVTGGKLGGYRQFVDEVLNPVQNDVGRIGIAFAHQFNTQLKAGFDLNGNPGVDMFNEPAPTVIPGSQNAATTPPVTVSISDYTALTGSDYQINVNADGTVVTNLRNNQVTKFAGPPPGNTQFTLEGVDFDVTGSSAGDTFLVMPTRNVASSLQLQMDVINDAALIAASAPPAGPAIGDNSNALKLADLQLASTSLKQGSYQDAFNDLVGTVGVITQSSAVDAAAQKKLLESVKLQREAVSGVNLDEEGANLVLFQQSYQAAAQVITVARTTFDALLGAVK